MLDANLHGGSAMVRKLLIAAAAAALLSGCVTGYSYRGGGDYGGDYYYGSADTVIYGAPYSSIGYGYPGGWYGHIGYGWGYPGGISPYYRPWGYYGRAYYPYFYSYSPYFYGGYRSGYHRPYYRPHGDHRPQRPQRPGHDGGSRPPRGETVGPPRPHPRPDSTNLTPEYALERLRPGAARSRSAGPGPTRVGPVAPVGRTHPQALPRPMAAPAPQSRPAISAGSRPVAPARSAPAPVRQSAPTARPARSTRPSPPHRAESVPETRSND